MGQSTMSIDAQSQSGLKILVKVPLTLNCILRWSNWELVAANPQYLHAQDFTMNYLNLVLICGLYVWELINNNPKPTIMVHHLTVILLCSAMMESMPMNAAGNLVRQATTFGILLATGGALTITLPLLVCGLAPNANTRRRAMLLGATAYAVYYTFFDVAIVGFFYLNARTVQDVPSYILYIPGILLTGIVPSQIMDFSRLLAGGLHIKPPSSKENFQSSACKPKRCGACFQKSKTIDFGCLGNTKSLVQAATLTRATSNCKTSKSVLVH